MQNKQIGQARRAGAGNLPERVKRQRLARGVLRALRDGEHISFSSTLMVCDKTNAFRRDMA